MVYGPWTIDHRREQNVGCLKLRGPSRTQSHASYYGLSTMDYGP